MSKDPLGLKRFIRTVDNFPIDGIAFRDITSLIETPEAFVKTCDELTKITRNFGADIVASIESRGFIFAGTIARDLNLPFVLARKPGKLPNETYKKTFDLEYGSTSIEIQKNTVIKNNQKIVIVDDLVATGGTAIACSEIFTENFNVKSENILILSIIDLPELGGSRLISEKGYLIETLIDYWYSIVMNKEYGRLMVDIEGISLSDEDKLLIESKHVGGIIFFARNFTSLDQIKDLVDQIKNIKENIIIAVDQEGGKVQRFDKDFTKIPSMQKVSEYAKNINDISFLKEIGWLISSELVAAGIDINFAPVLDIDKNTSSIIGDRAFSDKADEVLFLASKFIDGMHEAGMKSTGKHFPGHGGIYADSHKEIAKDSRTLDELLQSDIKPYKELVKKL